MKPASHRHFSSCFRSVRLILDSGALILRVSGLVVLLAAFVLPPVVFGQAESGNIQGAVTDPSGAAIPGATVTIYDPVSQFQQTATTDSSGNFSISNVPFNPY
ncbi:MAG: carboxypeptidase-like regulatory domain-containing protein, partial [Terriglobia bacterium]